MTTVLALTAEPGLPQALQCALDAEGFRLVRAADRATALACLRTEQPDLVLLDLALPGEEGLALCRWLRQQTLAPILALTTEVGQAEQAVAEEACADDFNLAPFQPQPVAARLRALGRRGRRPPGAPPDLVRLGDLTLLPAHHRVTVGGKPVSLTRSELALLAALAAEPGRPLTRAELAQALRANGPTSARAVDSHIKNLRAKIEPDRRRPRYVLTVHGVGYKLCP